MDLAQSNSQAPNDEQARAAWLSRECATCDRAKRAHSAFCPTCTAALTIWVRNWLNQGPDSAHWCDQYRSALRHLQLNTTRRRSLPLFYGGWPHTSSDDLDRAGYLFINHAYCNVPGCKARVVWYWTPGRGKIAVNLADYQPHRTTCVNPDYFQQQKAAQASAKKQRRKA